MTLNSLYAVQNKLQILLERNYSISIYMNICFLVVYQVGLELIPRNYDMDSTTLFKKSGIISMIPVYKLQFLVAYNGLVWLHLISTNVYFLVNVKKTTIYQQKALDINERELGLDHPDTMKSYGDLAVFYYWLQHTELALKYIS